LLSSADRFRQEDPLLTAVADAWRSRGFVVIACGGNQGRYWVNLRGRRKAPDLVAVTPSGDLLIVEAKVAGSALFRSGLTPSDAYSLRELVADQKATSGALALANEWLTRLGLAQRAHTVVPILLSASPVPPQLLAETPDLVILQKSALAAPLEVVSPGSYSERF